MRHPGKPLDEEKIVRGYARRSALDRIFMSSISDRNQYSTGWSISLRVDNAYARLLIFALNADCWGAVNEVGIERRA